MTEIIGKMMELTENSKVDLTWSERSKWEIKIMTSCCGEGNVEVSGFSYQQLTTASIPQCFIYLILPSLSSTHFHFHIPIHPRILILTFFILGIFVFGVFILSIFVLGIFILGIFILATQIQCNWKYQTLCYNSPMSEAHQTSDKKFSMYLVIL